MMTKTKTTPYDSAEYLKTDEDMAIEDMAMTRHLSLRHSAPSHAPKV